jgi:alkyldihydroxyacetonephosphate synthase
MSAHRAAALLERALGQEAVRTSPAELAAYGQDSWPMSRLLARVGSHAWLPDIVVRARTVHDVREAVRIARECATPLVPWGLGSSVTGQPLALHGGIIIDLSGLTGDPVLQEMDGFVTVGAGLRGSDLENWLNARGRTLGHIPQSLTRSSVGGWLATRAAGQFSSRYGGIEDQVVGYQVVLPDGAVIELIQRPRSASGPDLRHLFLGSEGTLGIITQVTLKVLLRPEHQVVEAFSVPTIGVGLSVARELMQLGLRPHIVRLYDQDEAGRLPSAGTAGRAVLFLGHEGTRAVAEAEHGVAASVAARHDCVSLGPDPVNRWLRHRFDFSAVENRVARPGGYAETIEVANFWSRLEPMYDEMKQVLAPLADEVLAHFSHVYPVGSSVYFILAGQASDDHAALARLSAIWPAAMETVIRHKGELSHHHGAGIARLPFIRDSLGSSHDVLARLKRALDPDGMLNPGKLAL